jgi:hypothetical protein
MKNIWKKIKNFFTKVNNHLTVVNKALEEIRDRGFGPKS